MTEKAEIETTGEHGYPDFDPVPGMERAAAIFSKVLAGIDRQLAKSPLNPSERRIVRLIHARPGLTDLEIASRLAMSRPQVSRVMASLIQSGLVSFEPSPRHGRQRLLAVTEAGKSVAQEIDEASKVAFALEFGHLAPAEQRILDKVQQVEGSKRPLGKSVAIELRDPEPDDLSWLFRIMIAVGKPNAWGMPYVAEQASWFAACARQLNYNLFPGWIAYRGGERVGGCLVALGLNPSPEDLLDATHATLFALFVAPRSRRLGIGSRLVQAAVEKARDLDLHSIRTSLVSEQEQLIRLLKLHKFKAEREPVQDFRYDTKDVFREYTHGFALRRPGRPKGTAS